MLRNIGKVLAIGKMISHYIDALFYHFRINEKLILPSTDGLNAGMDKLKAVQQAYLKDNFSMDKLKAAADKIDQGNKPMNDSVVVNRSVYEKLLAENQSMSEKLDGKRQLTLGEFLRIKLSNHYPANKGDVTEVNVSDLNSLLNKNDLLNKEFTATTRRLDAEMSENLHLRNRVNGEEGRVERQRKVIQELQDKVASLQDLNGKQATHILELRAQSEKDEQRFYDVVADRNKLRELWSKLQKMNEDQKSTIGNLSEEIHGLNKQIRNISAGNPCAELMTSELEKQLKDAKVETYRLSEKLKDADNDTKFLTMQLSNQDAKVAGLEHAIRTLHSSNNDGLIAKLNAEVSELQGLLVQRNRRIENLAMNNKELHDRVCSLAKKADTNWVQQTQHQKARETIGKLNMRVNQLEKTIEGLKAERDAMYATAEARLVIMNKLAENVERARIQSTVLKKVCDNRWEQILELNEGKQMWKKRAYQSLYGQGWQQI